MIDGDRFVYEDVVDEKEDDEEEEEEEEEQELCYQTTSRWKLPQRDNVLKYAKLDYCLYSECVGVRKAKVQ
jgi:hypothetical protein